MVVVTAGPVTVRPDWSATMWRLMYWRKAAALPAADGLVEITMLDPLSLAA
jgi:hypothetical protein